MGAITEQLRIEVDRYEMATGKRARVLRVARDVRDGYLAELLAGESPSRRKIRKHDEEIQPIARVRCVGDEPDGPAGEPGAAVLSSDCRLPLEHCPGCICAALLR